jgi:UDP-glucose 4-epimerase
MRVAVTGASGNVGTAVLRALRRRPDIEQIVGIARRPPFATDPLVTWRALDIRNDVLVEAFSGVDAVIHLAWLIQPSRDRELLRSVNVTGSRRVFDAAAAAGAAIVHASSVGVYSPGPKDRAVDESWPRRGVATSTYAQDKAAAEDQLDEIESANPGLRVVRMRPGLIFQSEAAAEIARYFLGPLVPMRLLRAGTIPVVPFPDEMRFQAAHADDIAEAYALAVVRAVRGAFNLAADPVLDREQLARLLHGKPLRVPTGLLRRAARYTYALRLQPTEPGWVDMAAAAPLLDTTRAREVLGWVPEHSSLEALSALFEGFAAGMSGDTPVLRRRR